MHTPGGAKGLILAYAMSFVLTTVGSVLAFGEHFLSAYLFLALSAGSYLCGAAMHFSLPFEDK